MPASHQPATQGAIERLRRLGLGKLATLAPKPEVIRYQRARPDELIHLDIGKLGCIAGIGHRITGDRRGQSRKRGTGWEYLHVAIDDASRLACSEILPNQRKESAITFTRRALAWFERCAITVERVMTDNDSAYKSFAYRDVLAACGIRHKRTRPYTPRTNGKAERFIQTSLPANGPTPPTKALPTAPMPFDPRSPPTIPTAITPPSTASRPSLG